MLILGAGLAGCIAGVLNQEATIWEKGNGVTQHQAVLRFRSPDVGVAVGIPFKKVKVYKNICYEGNFVDSDIRMSNLYSRKVTGGGLFDRSINNMETEVRWIAPEGFHDMLKELCTGRIHYNSPINMGSNVRELLSDYKNIVSTMPIDILSGILGKMINIDANKMKIYVNKWIVFGADLQQTIYFPGKETSVYRATMTRDIFRIESLEPLKEGEFDFICNCFGMQLCDLDTEILANHEQPIGKLVPMDERVRREFITYATDEWNIYSLGRFATWRNLLLDDVLDDIYKIKKMMVQDTYDKRKVTL